MSNDVRYCLCIRVCACASLCTCTVHTLVNVCVCVLPMSSSSDVIDLERMDSAVVGARFGGGGAKENNDTHCFIYTRVSQMKNNFSTVHCKKGSQECIIIIIIIFYIDNISILQLHKVCLVFI